MPHCNSPRHAKRDFIVHADNSRFAFRYFVLRLLPLDLLGAEEVIFDVCISSPMYLRARMSIHVGCQHSDKRNLRLQELVASLKFLVLAFHGLHPIHNRLQARLQNLRLLDQIPSRLFF